MSMLQVVCRCRNCGVMYDTRKARGDYKGFCSAACQHEKARTLGFRKRAGYTPPDSSEYAVLKRNQAIGDVPVAIIDLPEKWLLRLKSELEKEINVSPRATSQEELAQIIQALSEL